MLAVLLRFWSPGGGDSSRSVLGAVGYGVFHISSLVSPLIGGGYWAVFSSCDMSSVSRGLGGRMSRMWSGDSSSVVTRHISFFAGVDGVVRFGLSLHGASNAPGPRYGLGCSSSDMSRISVHSGMWRASNRRLVLLSISLDSRSSVSFGSPSATDSL